MSSPTVTWSSAGGANGSLTVSANSHPDIFENKLLGDPSGWEQHATPQDSAYSREVRVWSDFTWIHVISAGDLNVTITVTSSVFQLPGLQEDRYTRKCYDRTRIR